MISRSWVERETNTRAPYFEMLTLIAGIWQASRSVNQYGKGYIFNNATCSEVDRPAFVARRTATP